MDNKILIGGAIIGLFSVSLYVYTIVYDVPIADKAVNTSNDIPVNERRMRENNISTSTANASSSKLSSRDLHLSAPGMAYDRMKQQLVGPPAHSKVQSYDKLFPNPTSIFPYEDTFNKSSDNSKEKLREIHETLTKKNKLLHSIINKMDMTIKGDESQINSLISDITDVSNIRKYVFVGTQSVGKSHVLNAITSLSLSAMDVGTCTKSPIYGNMRTVQYGKEHFAINGEDKKFEEILIDLRQMFESQANISDKEIRLEVHAWFIPYPIDYVDLPGYAINEPTEASIVIEMIKKYAQDPNVVFVMVSDAERDPATDSTNVLKTLRETVDDSRIIFIINKVNLWMGGRNSPRQFVERIKNIVDYLECSEENLPYLFTVPNDERLDAKSANFQKMSPAQQVELWENLSKEGEELIEKLKVTYSSHWKTYFKNGYPIDRLGIKSWKENTAASLFERFSDTLVSFVEEEVRQTPLTDGMDKLEVPKWPLIMNEFSVEFVNLFERVGKNQDGIWKKIIELGGKEFLENEQIRKKRTDACVDYRMSERGDLKPQNSEKENIYGRVLIDPIGYLQRHTERGNTLFLSEVYDLRNWMLASYVNLTDFDIDILSQKERRHSTMCDIQITPYVISDIANRIFTEYTVRQQVARLECTVLRIARSALWLLLQAHKKSSDHLYILAMQQKFQDFVNKQIHKYLKNIYERSSRWIAKAAGHSMDGPINDRHLIDKKMYLQHIFQDIATHWPEIPENHTCIQLVNHVSELKSNTFESFYKLIRSQAKLHYSDRILILAEMITFTHFMEWEDVAADMHELRKSLYLNVGEQTLMQHFNLDKGYLSASQLAEEKKKLTATIHDALFQIRSRLPATLEALKHFNPYQIKRKRLTNFKLNSDNSTSNSLNNSELTK